MDTFDKASRDPWLVVAWGFAIALGVAGALWGLSYLVPALGAAFGYLAAGAVHGTVEGAMAGWFGAAALYGGTVIIVGGGVRVGILVVNEVAKKRYQAAVVILAACQTFLLDVVKELWPTGDKTSKWLFKATTSLLFAIAAEFWKKGGWKLQASAMVAWAAMPVMVLALAAGPYLDLGLRDALARVDTSVWFAFGGFGCFVLVAILLAWLL
jgi:hypothetical protein